MRRLSMKLVLQSLIISLLLVSVAWGQQTQTSRADLKGYFNVGDIPSETEYADVIDSLRHFTDEITINIKDFPGLSANNITVQLQNAIDSVATFTKLVSMESGHSDGGATILIPPGDWLVTNTITYSGGMKFQGAGSGRTIIKFTPATAIPMWLGDTSKPTLANNWYYTHWLDMSFIGSYLDAKDDTCFDIGGLNSGSIRNCYIEHFGTAIKARNGKSTYFNLIENCEMRNNFRTIWGDSQLRSLTVQGGFIWIFAGGFGGDPVPTFIGSIDAGGKVSLQNCSVEVHNSGGDLDDDVFTMFTGAGWVITGRSEISGQPLVTADYKEYWIQPRINLNHILAFPAIKFTNFNLPHEVGTDSGSSTDVHSIPRHTLDRGVRLATWANTQFEDGASTNWDLTVGGVDVAFSTTGGFLNDGGCIVYTSPAGGSGLTDIARYRILEANIPERFSGRRLFGASLIQFEDNADWTDLRFQLQTYEDDGGGAGAGLLSTKQASLGRRLIDYGNNWHLFVVSIDIPTAGIEPGRHFDMQWRVDPNGDQEDQIIRIASGIMYHNGVELIPLDPTN